MKLPFYIGTALVLLTACGAAAVSSDNAVDDAAMAATGGAQKPPHSAGPAPGDDWTGQYEGRFDGGHGTVTIWPRQSGGAHPVRVGVLGERGCGGSAEGTGTPQGDTFSFTMDMPDDLCRIDLSRRGNTLRVVEGPGCFQAHGMSCDFNGTVTRVSRADFSGPVPGARQAASSDHNVVGAWVARGHSCQGTGLIIEADGTYGTDAERGTWSVSGDRLTFVTRETFELGDDVMIPVHDPQPSHTTILSSGPRAFSYRESDGSVWHMVRCR